MKSYLRMAWRVMRGILVLTGVATLAGTGLVFSQVPWRIYKHFSQFPAPSAAPPTHILLMGGGGIPSDTGLLRTFFGAQAAALHPQAELFVAMPLDADQSLSSRAYLDELILRGVSPDRARILPNGRNTREQSLRLAQQLGDRKAEATILIVTSPEHIRRTAASLRKAGIPHLAAFPTHPLSIDDPLPWKARELDAPGPAPAARPAVPDIGSSFLLRYNLWANIGYSFVSLREATAMAYYRLRGWI